MNRCTRCGLDTACHTLLDDTGLHPYCVSCLFLEAYEAEQQGETAVVSFVPVLTVVA